MNDCIFCKIAQKTSPASIEGESESAIAFKSIDPVAEHHIIIIPKTHIESFLDLEENHSNIFMDMAKLAQKIIDDKKVSEGYKLIFNGGKYQSIKHIHWHLLAGKLEDEDDVLNKT